MCSVRVWRLQLPVPWPERKVCGVFFNCVVEWQPRGETPTVEPRLFQKAFV